MSEQKLYGAKCHLCGHLSGPTHSSEPSWFTEGVRCPTCLFCQREKIIALLVNIGDDAFSPAVLQASRDFMDGKPNPLIDKLREEIMAEQMFCQTHMILKEYCKDIDHTDLHACPEDPELLKGQPIGMYHCPACGCMVIAAMPHSAHDDGCALGLDVKAFWDAI